MTADLAALEKHIDAINEKALAWLAEDPENRSVGILHTDMDDWAAMDITTVDEFEHSMAYSAFSDARKELRGMRPRLNPADFETEELIAMTEALYQEEEDHKVRCAVEEARIKAAHAATREPMVGLTHNPFAGKLGERRERRIESFTWGELVG